MGIGEGGGRERRGKQKEGVWCRAPGVAGVLGPRKSQKCPAEMAGAKGRLGGEGGRGCQGAGSREPRNEALRPCSMTPAKQGGHPRRL